MNFTLKTLVKIVGLLMGISGLAMIPPIFCAIYFKESSLIFAFSITSAISIALGFSMYLLVPMSRKPLKTRDGYLIVVMCWLVCSFFGALPYFISGEVPSIIDALFESVAGYTTTGATVLAEAHYPSSLILWKAITHWLGGMGILVFIISILPTLGISGLCIASAESPGHGLSQVSSRVRDLAKFLYSAYICLTLLAFLLLWIGSEMNPFEALINSLGSVSTSGLFLHKDGVAYYDSLYVELVISIFTILASVNFVMYIHLIKREFGHWRENIELKIFIGIIFIATLLVTINLTLSNVYDNFFQSLRYAFFQVTAFSTTSGFSLTDYTNWPSFSLGILLALLFIGGCAASTAGSIKVIRIIVMIKLIARGFFIRIHPRAVKAIKVGDSVLSAQMVSSITTFIILYFATFLLGSLVLSLQGLDLETTFSATISLMSTAGVGFGAIGENGDFSMFAPPLRLFMSLLMLVGRLELFTVFLLFFPSFWNPNRAKSR